MIKTNLVIEFLYAFSPNCGTRYIVMHFTFKLLRTHVYCFKIVILNNLKYFCKSCKYVCKSHDFCFDVIISHVVHIIKIRDYPFLLLKEFPGLYSLRSFVF